MSSLPLATVATVTYNSDKCVAEAIESVLCQSDQNLELVICDDCSTDRTWDIIQRYHDPRIRAFRNPRNLGEYPNRNRALSLAQGEYLVYIDSDDILYPHGLEFIVRMFDAFPEAAMALARPWSQYFVYPVLLAPRQFFLCEYLGRAVLAQSFTNLFFKTSVLRAVGGFDPRYRAGDFHIQHRIALNHPCLLINDNLARWGLTPGQATEELNRGGAVIGWMESLKWKREFLAHPECPLAPEEIKVARANLYGRFIRMALYRALRGHVVQAFRLLTAARIPLDAWEYTFVPGRYDYMSRVSAAWPMRTALRRHPYAKIPPALES